MVCDFDAFEAEPRRPDCGGSFAPAATRGVQSMKTMRIASIFAFAALLSTPTMAAGGSDKDLKLTGCLIRGEGDGAGYLLTGRAFDPAAANGGTRVTPSTVGTTGDFANVF